MSDLLLYPHAQALLDALNDGLSFPVGDHRAPKSADGKIVAPCVVLYMTPGVNLPGSVGCTEKDGLLRFRLTSVGLTAGQAQHTADLAFGAINGLALTVPERGIFRVHRTAIAGIERDDDVQPPCFYAPTPYSLMSMSAT